MSLARCPDTLSICRSQLYPILSAMNNWNLTFKNLTHIISPQNELLTQLTKYIWDLYVEK